MVPSYGSFQPDARLTGCPTTIDEERVAGHKGTCPRGQEQCGAANLVQLAPAAHRYLGYKGSVLSRIVQQRAIHFGRKGAGAQCVDRHTLTGPFQSERPCESKYSSFGRGVRGSALDAYGRKNRTYV